MSEKRGGSVELGRERSSFNYERTRWHKLWKETVLTEINIGHNRWLAKKWVQCLEICFFAKRLGVSGQLNRITFKQ